MLVALNGSPGLEPLLSAGSRRLPSNDLFLSPTLVQNSAAELDVDPIFGPIRRRTAAGWLAGPSIGTAPLSPTRPAIRRAGHFLHVVASSVAAGTADCLCIPDRARRCCASVTAARSKATSRLPPSPPHRLHLRRVWAHCAQRTWQAEETTREAASRSPPARLPRHTTLRARDERSRWRRRRGSRSRRRRRSGRRSSTRAGSTRSAGRVIGCYGGPKELLDAAGIGELRSRRDGPFGPSQRSPARAPTPTPSRCRAECAAALPSTQIASGPSLSVPATGPDSVPPQEGEHAVEVLLNRGQERGTARNLWRGHMPTHDEWLLEEEEPVHCRVPARSRITAECPVRGGASSLPCTRWPSTRPPRLRRPAAGRRSGRLPAADSR